MIMVFLDLVTHTQIKSWRYSSLYRGNNLCFIFQHQKEGRKHEQEISQFYFKLMRSNRKL